jgi:acetyl esterase/lipase
VNVERNVVYGMYSGLALLMDVYRPERPNGLGLIHISGSGWSAPLGLDARPLKERPAVEIEALPLVAAGYTVCTINHRATPRFTYPAAVEDAQRAVRYFRHHASAYGIDPRRIGAIGGSSGGQLVSLLGVLDGAGDPDDESPINRQSAGVQCVVARAVVSDFLTFAGPLGAVFLGASLRLDLDRGASLPLDPALGSPEYRLAKEASPITHVSAGAPPFLLIHGDADQTVPFAQSEAMATALKGAGVPVKLIAVPGGPHGPGIIGAPAIAAEIRAWFDDHLKP